MSLQQFLGRWQQLAQLADAAGWWRGWIAAQPVLGQVASACAVGEAVEDRDAPGRANELLLGLVRVGSVDGGVDERAATFVASLLVPGGNRIVCDLSSLGPDVDAVVAGALWLQVRQYPWRRRPRAVARNTLMDTRRAVLAEFGATTGRRPALVPVAPLELTEAVDRRGGEGGGGQVVADLALLRLLVWAQAGGLLGRGDAALLWELVLAGTDPQTAVAPAGGIRGVGSPETVRVAAARGVSARTVRRERDRVVRRLRRVAGDFQIDADWAVHPRGVGVLTRVGPLAREDSNA